MEMDIKSDFKQSITGSDALILATKHEQFLNIDLDLVKELMKEKPIIIDGRNTLKRETIEKAGFHYQGVGKVFKEKR
jgi:UDP-N-acetyl-D-mannosaminuronate dehydrogenase